MHKIWSLAPRYTFFFLMYLFFCFVCVCKLYYDGEQ